MTGETIESEDTQELEPLAPEMEAAIDGSARRNDQGYDPYNSAYAMAGGHR